MFWISLIIYLLILGDTEALFLQQLLGRLSSSSKGDVSTVVCTTRLVPTVGTVWDTVNVEQCRPYYKTHCTRGANQCHTIQVGI